MKVKVYLNHGEDHFFGFHNDFANSPKLILAAEFELPYLGDAMKMLERIYEQLNIGGDLIPATEWTQAYRAAGNRSLSVGDVVVIGEVAYAVGSYSWDKVSADEITAALSEGAAQ